MKDYCWAVQLKDGLNGWWTVATFASSRDAKVCIRSVLFKRTVHAGFRVVHADHVVKPSKRRRAEALEIQAKAVRA